MTDIEERFAGNNDDGSLIERQLFSRASVKLVRHSLLFQAASIFANQRS